MGLALPVQPVAVGEVRLGSDKLALFVRPEGSLRSPFVIFLHSASGSKEQFLEEAKDLARHGVGSLLPQGPSAAGLNADDGLAMFRNTSRALSEGVDYLKSSQMRREVDGDRLLFVGKNLGGGLGGYWLTHETRVRGAIMTGAIPNLSEFYVKSQHPVAKRVQVGKTTKELEEFARLLGPTDLLQTLPRLKGVQLFLQFGVNDEWITGSATSELSRRLPRASAFEWTNDDHEMRAIESVRQREQWILESFGLPGP